MKFFSKKETLGIILILLLIAIVSLYNFKISLRRMRDTQRRADLDAVANALNRYKNDFGFYPLSLDGKIVACLPEGKQIEDGEQWHLRQIDWFEFFRPCQWGEDSFVDVYNPANLSYLDRIPTDPQSDSGAFYVYFSNKERLQLYTGLEGKNESELQPAISARGLSCGTRICNFGKSSDKTPLEKSIEEYENESLPKDL